MLALGLNAYSVLSSSVMVSEASWQGEGSRMVLVVGATAARRWRHLCV